MTGAIPTGSNPAYLTPHPFSIMGAELATLADRDEATVRAQLEDEVRNNSDLTALSDQLFDGIDSSLGLVAGTLKALLTFMFGIEPTIDPDAPESPTVQLLNSVDDFFTHLRQFLNDINFLDPDFDFATAQESFATNVIQPFLEVVTDVLNALIPAGLLPMINIGQISNTAPNLFLNGGFDDPVSLSGSGIYTHDAVVGRTKGGSAKTVANGTTRILFSNPILVGPGQVVDIDLWTRWAGVTSGVDGIKVFVTPHNADLAYPSELMVAITPSGTQTVWQNLSCQYTTPSSGVTAIVVELHVTTTVTAGSVWFDDAVAKKLIDNNKLPQEWIAGLVAQLNDMIDDTQNTLNGIWQGIFGEVPTVALAVNDIIDALQAIPAQNVSGLQGGSIVNTFETTINTLWSGFAKLFGVSGKSIGDVANLASDTVTTGQNALDLAEWTNAVQGIRNNKSLMEGMDETEESNFLMSHLFSGGADPSSVISATSASVPVAFWRATEFAKKGVISWFGKGFTNVTALNIDVYKLNFDTETLELLHSSSDQVGQVTGSWKLCQYFMDVSDRVDVVAGDVIAVAWRVTGTGTHSIAGRAAGAWLPDHPTVVPARPAATRTGVGDLAFGSISYSSNIPWFGIGIAEGDTPPAFFAPRTTAITTVGTTTYDIPDWATHVNVVMVGAGGGGRAGDPAFFLTGAGGDAGNWNAETLVRGVDFPDVTGASFTVTITNGGFRGTWPAGSGQAGGNTTRNAITSGKAAIVATGGSAQSNPAGGSEDAHGDSPGNYTYDGDTFVGGGIATGGSGQGAEGQPAGGGGGGGSGGTWGVAFDGGSGARGGAWCVAKQIL